MHSALRRLLLPPGLSLLLLTAAQAASQGNGDFSHNPKAKELPTETILVKSAWSSARDSTTPLPEGGRVSKAIYTNAYFGLAYPLSPEWTEKYSGPPPSDSGYYVPAPSQTVSPSLASIDSHAEKVQPPSQSRVLSGLTAVLLAAGALLVWRGRKARSISPAKIIASPARPLQPSDILRDALRQELSRLLDDRRRGLISRKEYTSAKLALKESVKRALSKASLQG
jgi:hypothetical protein